MPLYAPGDPHDVVLPCIELMSAEPQPPSIHAIPLPATGGTAARMGFNLQDHVAASYCIRMMAESSIKEVWNEAHDDVTLIWQLGAGEEVEFIQVKGHELDQLWSIARLCEQDTKTKRRSCTSIFERSLSRHRCSEPCRFRIVTARPVMDELRPLTLPLGSKQRAEVESGLSALVVKLAEKLKDARSPNGTDGAFWVSRTVWQEVHSLDAVRAHNLLAFETELERLGHLLLAGQREELYQKLVRKIGDAATARQAEQKKIRRDPLLKWLSEAVDSLAHPGPLGGLKMAEKMEAAKLPEDAVMAAHESRNRYRLRSLRDRYSEPLAHAWVEGEIVARLSTLRARLDAGDYADDGPSFHKRCLDNLTDLCAASPDAGKLGLAFLHGCMYSITDRCGHRFRRVTP